ALGRIAERAVVPVVANSARVVALPSSHPMHFGSEPGPLFRDADLIVAIESDAPWFPHLQQPPSGCRVVHVGEDPVFQRYPMRSFPSDLTIMAGTTNARRALDGAIAEKLAKAKAESRIDARRKHLDELQQQRQGRLVKDSAAPENAITKAFLSRMI